MNEFIEYWNTLSRKERWDVVKKSVIGTVLFFLFVISALIIGG